MVKRINVSIKESDKKFCLERDLKPSHLLRERIDQVRNESNPSLVEELKKSRLHAVNIDKKMGFLNEFIVSLGDKVKEVVGEEAHAKIYKQL